MEPQVPHPTRTRGQGQPRTGAARDQAQVRHRGSSPFRARYLARRLLRFRVMMDEKAKLSEDLRCLRVRMLTVAPQEGPTIIQNEFSEAMHWWSREGIVIRELPARAS